MRNLQAARLSSWHRPFANFSPRIGTARLRPKFRCGGSVPRYDLFRNALTGSIYIYGNAAGIGKRNGGTSPRSKPSTKWHRSAWKFHKFSLFRRRLTRRRAPQPVSRAGAGTPPKASARNGLRSATTSESAPKERKLVE